ncbi:phosphoribosyl-ATP pyrophosphohydrolase [Gammaproteobacteria bacterium]|nr:phosphoribosyl-ATP diphosphatase [Gammaproteobacteria bacterium]CAG0945039.1 phosphoribosyl-ATP pyrophosphohydrolase [Gammaproteobacteria bacterium]
MSDAGIGYLQELERVIEQRKAASAEQSYTARLYAAGPSRIAQKLGEEAVELALASVQGNRQRTLSEAADLVYHLLVLLRSHDLTLADVARELSQRQR